MCQGIVYKVTNLNNGKCYIGKTTYKLEQRKGEHLSRTINGSETYFHKAIRKYDIENFKWEVICECDDPLLLNVMETFKIMVNHSHVSENGYNLTWGGDGRSNGYKHTEESKKKMSDAKKGMIFTEGHKKILSETRKGKKHTAETKKKISETLKNKVYTAEKKKFMSEETRRRMSEAKKGKRNTEEHNKNISEARKGKKHTEETRKKIGESNKHKRGPYKSKSLILFDY